ncbi:unnamed protein product, partial [Phaeothamnion confervicola]
DSCLYHWHSPDGKVVFIVCLYVDDLLITGHTLVDIDAFEASISLAFPMKDLGVLKYLLGMESIFGDRSVS